MAGHVACTNAPMLAIAFVALVTRLAKGILGAFAVALRETPGARGALPAAVRAEGAEVDVLVVVTFSVLDCDVSWACKVKSG